MRVEAGEDVRPHDLHKRLEQRPPRAHRELHHGINIFGPQGSNDHLARLSGWRSISQQAFWWRARQRMAGRTLSRRLSGNGEHFNGSPPRSNLCHSRPATSNPQPRDKTSRLPSPTACLSRSCGAFRLVSLSLTGPDRVSAVFLKPAKPVTTFTGRSGYHTALLRAIRRKLSNDQAAKQLSPLGRGVTRGWPGNARQRPVNGLACVIGNSRW